MPLVHNVATIKLLSVTLKQVDVREAVKEKAPDRQAAPARAGEPPSPPPPDTSYSRVSGMIGAIVLAAFFRAVGNVVLYKAFTAIADIQALLTGIGSFFAIGHVRTNPGNPDRIWRLGREGARAAPHPLSQAGHSGLPWICRPGSMRSCRMRTISTMPG